MIIIMKRLHGEKVIKLHLADTSLIAKTANIEVI